MKKKLVLFALVLYSVFANAQSILDRVTDSAAIAKQHDLIISKLDSAFIFPDTTIPFNPKDCIIFEIYNCHDNSNCKNSSDLSEGLIDTSLFSKKYFISGKFLEDWIILKEKGKARIDISEIAIYDTLNMKSYSCPPKKPRLHNIHHVGEDCDTTYSVYGYSIHREIRDFDYIGTLFKIKQVDFVFCYPTFVSASDFEIPSYDISWDFGYYFAKKGNQFYIIGIDSENEKIYPLEEVVENHWDWITNVIKKED